MTDELIEPVSQAVALNKALAEAYHLSEVARDKSKAVALLRDRFAEDAALLDQARAECARADAVVQARGSGGRNGCHITVVVHSLLTAALGGR